MKLILLSLFCIFSLGALAQEDAWVFFTDKENVAASIENPITILTQKAIDRKAMHNVTIDERDVPVNENYISQVKSQTGITVLAKSKWMNCVHVRGNLEAITALESLNFVAGIEYADDDLTRSTDDFGFTKEDPEIPQQRVDFTYGSTENQITMLSVEALHQQDYTGEGMTIAVMDSGFPGVNTVDGFARLRDADKLLDGYDFVGRDDDEFAFASSSHGTRVLSDIVGFIQDQFVGTAPDASVYCFRTEDIASENPVEESYWVEAAERADSLGVDVINTSLGYRTYDNPNYSYTYEDMDGETAFISRGATLAFEKGMLVVTSAGNSGTGMISAPADAVGAFTVGAVNANGQYASFSSIGPSSDGRVKPDVMAKGSGSAVIDQNGTITTNNGTSFSSPIMAGAMASFWSALPNATAAEVMQLARESATMFNNPSPQMGYGIPDFEAALGELLTVDSNAFAKILTVYPNPAQNQAFVNIPENAERLQVEIFTMLGQRVASKTLAESDFSLPIRHLQSGMYLIRIQNGTKIITQKLIKS